MKHDVGIALIEFPLFSPRDDLELFDTPDLRTNSLAGNIPCGFGITSVFSDAFLEL